MFRPTTVVLPIALMAFAIVSFLFLINYSITTHLQSAAAPSKQLACPDDAKICPDGTAVGRTGSDCAFAACPNPPVNSNRTGTPGANTNSLELNVNLPAGDSNKSEIACATDVRSCSDGSYVQRVPPSCEFAACPPGTEPVPPTLNQ